ncbi:quinone oxidoreductase-like protein 2 [Cimex lectularius]|uniref:Enoyl reductase (ER) domain-containing protein n=1 Tax=Cimex lectularius TaxID=79782 RepID=A0A8I6S5W5_CIMLE|nr:quinone oxidoreductase-like protein 2 [Cimex lectularius]
MSFRRGLALFSRRIGHTGVKRGAAVLAARLEKIGQPLDLENVNTAKIGPGQVKIDVHNCSLNASDFLLSQGSNPGKFKLPIVPGYEVSGVVKEAKDCKTVREGDRVVALSKDTLGGFSTECVADENDVWLLPSNLDFEKGAAIADAFGTAIIGLVYRGHLSEKKTVLVTLAPGHGFAQLELAASVYKTKVIAVCMNEMDTQLLRDRGAWTSMSYDPQEMVNAVNKLTKDKGVDVIYDTLGGDVLKTCLKCIAYEGSVIIAGYTLQDLPLVKISHLLALPPFNLSGASLTSYRKHAFDIYRQAVTDVLDMHDQGLAQPTIAATFPLEQVNEAIEMFKTKQPIGKIILAMKNA